MYIIATKSFIETELNEILYLGWQEPAWDEDGYFWTRKETIKEMIKDGYIFPEQPFLFDSEEKAKQLAKNIELTKDYFIKEWL